MKQAGHRPPPSEPRGLTPQLATSSERNRSLRAWGSLMLHFPNLQWETVLFQPCFIGRQICELLYEDSGCCQVKFTAELPPHELITHTRRCLRCGCGECTSPSTYRRGGVLSREEANVRLHFPKCRGLLPKLLVVMAVVN